jgi:hypothetical protein
MIPTYVNIEQYDGDIRCQKCKSLMHLSLRKGTIVKYSMKDDKSGEAKGRQLLEEIASELKKARNK